MSIDRILGYPESGPMVHIDRIDEAADTRWLRPFVGPFGVTHVSRVDGKLVVSMYRSWNRLGRVVDAGARAAGWEPDGPLAALTFGGKTGGVRLRRRS